MSGESCPVPAFKSEFSDEEIVRRRKICAECPDRRDATFAGKTLQMRCKFCGCPVESLVKHSKQCRNTAAPRW
jgi:hypothetical protein